MTYDLFCTGTGSSAHHKGHASCAWQPSCIALGTYACLGARQRWYNHTTPDTRACTWPAWSARSGLATIPSSRNPQHRHRPGPYQACASQTTICLVPRASPWKHARRDPGDPGVSSHAWEHPWSLPSKGCKVIVRKTSGFPYFRTNVIASMHRCLLSWGPPINNVTSTVRLPTTSALLSPALKLSTKPW